MQEEEEEEGAYEALVGSKVFIEKGFRWEEEEEETDDEETPSCWDCGQKDQDEAARKKKWLHERLGSNYQYYDWSRDHWQAPWYTKEEEARWMAEAKKKEKTSPAHYDETNWAYIIIDGPNIGIYEDYEEFQKKRDAEREAKLAKGEVGFSYKARKFPGGLGDAKKWCNATDEMPEEVFIYHKKKKLTITHKIIIVEDKF